MGLEDPRDPPSLKEALLFIGTQSWETRAKGKLHQKHKDLDFRSTTGYLVRAIRFPHLVKGTINLCKLRMGAFLTAKKLAQLKLLPTKFLTNCPFCSQKIPETESHLLFDCKAWEEHREMLKPMFLWKNFHKCNILGGRMHAAGISQEFMEVNWLGDSMLDRETIGWKRTAQFLQVVVLEREVRLKLLRS